jgi:hypothetical protein
MTKKYKIPVQSLIDHIKTATDVDPWAKEMAEELLKEQEAVVRCKDCKFRNDWNHCRIAFGSPQTPDDWFCADGERKDL